MYKYERINFHWIRIRLTESRFEIELVATLLLLLRDSKLICVKVHHILTIDRTVSCYDPRNNLA